MKIPKVIDELITKREKLGHQLMSVDSQIAEWMTANGIVMSITDIGCNGSFTLITEPHICAMRAREVIEEQGNDYKRKVD